MHARWLAPAVRATRGIDDVLEESPTERTKDAVVWFANSARGLRLGRLVLPVILPGAHASMDWLQVGATLQGP